MVFCKEILICILLNWIQMDVLSKKAYIWINRNTNLKYLNMETSKYAILSIIRVN